MSSPPSNKPRTFTARQANATLPLVGAIVSDLVQLARDVAERRQRLADLTGGRPRHPTDPYQEELAQIAQQFDSDSRQLQQYMDEVRQIGAEPKSALEGLVDFPSIMDGRPVYLCWKLGEPEVLYWHEVDAGYAGRQPLAAEVGAAEGIDRDRADALP